MSIEQPFVNLLQSIPFLRQLGVELISAKDGCAEIALNLNDGHMNAWNVGHGGIIMTMLDVVMAVAGRTLQQGFSGVVTVEMKTSFMQPAGNSGTRLAAHGRVLHRTSTLCFCDAEVLEGERLIAKAMGTFKYLKKFPE